MAHPNEDLMREGFTAFQSGDLQKVGDFFADDIVWHVPGKSPLAGDHKGIDAVMEFFGKTMEMTGGTFKLEVHDILANDEHGVALITTTGEREGKSLRSNGVQVIHIEGGKVTESWLHPDDAYANDEFWS